MHEAWVEVPPECSFFWGKSCLWSCVVLCCVALYCFVFHFHHWPFCIFDCTCTCTCVHALALSQAPLRKCAFFTSDNLWPPVILSRGSKVITRNNCTCAEGSLGTRLFMFCSLLLADGTCVCYVLISLFRVCCRFLDIVSCTQLHHQLFSMCSACAQIVDKQVL